MVASWDHTTFTCIDCRRRSARVRRQHRQGRRRPFGCHKSDGCHKSESALRFQADFGQVIRTGGLPSRKVPSEFRLFFARLPATLLIDSNANASAAETSQPPRRWRFSNVASTPTIDFEHPHGPSANFPIRLRKNSRRDS